MTKEALKLALEALIGARAFLESDAPVEIWGVNDQAITAIKEALAQPEQKFDTHSVPGKSRNTHSRQPEQEPLSDEEILTYRYMIDWTAEWSYINFARAIEAAHGIKENT